MAPNQFITVREAAQILGVSEKKIMDLIEQRRLQAYRIAEKFLRLKKTDILSLRNTGAVRRENAEFPYTSNERLADFFYFNDFYLVCGGITLALIYIIFNT